LKTGRHGRICAETFIKASSEVFKLLNADDIDIGFGWKSGSDEISEFLENFRCA